MFVKKPGSTNLYLGRFNVSLRTGVFYSGKFQRGEYSFGLLWWTRDMKIGNPLFLFSLDRRSCGDFLEMDLATGRKKRVDCYDGMTALTKVLVVATLVGKLRFQLSLAPVFGRAY
jgi:hypothetical protein